MRSQKQSEGCGYPWEYSGGVVGVDVAAAWHDNGKYNYWRIGTDTPVANSSYSWPDGYHLTYCLKTEWDETHVQAFAERKMAEWFPNTPMDIRVEFIKPYVYEGM